MATKTPILVCGDPTSDQIILKMPPRRGSDDDVQESYPSYILWEQAGGVHIAKPILEQLDFAPVLIPIHPKNGENLTSLVSIRCLKSEDGKERFISSVKTEAVPLTARIHTFEGYFKRTAPSTAQLGQDLVEPQCPTEEGYPYAYISDAAEATRGCIDPFPNLKTALKDGAWVVHKMHHPLTTESVLQKALSKLSKARTLLIVSAQDLRLQDIRLRGHLSWDAVAEDIQTSLRSNCLLRSMVDAYTAVCVLFDVEAGVLLEKAGDEIKAHMFLDKTRAEGDMARERPGSLYGQMNQFACCLLKALADQRGNLGDGKDTILPALAALRHYAKGEITLRSLDDQSVPQHPDPHWPIDPTNSCRTGLGYVDLSFDPNNHTSDPLSLVEHLSEEDTLGTAKNIVRSGKIEIENLPSARIGKFRTIDRTEIESFRTIQRLIDRYLEDRSQSKPLSFGVFGPPGSGKSYGIKQIAEERGIPWREFNMSEASAEALPGYFHEIRDIVLRGKTPLCFFDEFDAQGSRLVARFLAPMQDGVFRDGSRVHPVGRCILVFAGGTAYTAAQFVKGKGISDQPGAAEIKKLKLPDFASRLSGIINILGPNKQGSTPEASNAYLLRRAVLLRSLLERTMPQILANGNGTAAMSDKLIEAFLKTDTYVYGARSMEQILMLSALRGDQSTYGSADLPDVARLKLHLSKPKKFLKLATSC